METVERYVQRKCGHYITTFEKVMTEYGLVTESSVGEDVDGFYKKLTQAIIGNVMFDSYHNSETKWHGLHRKKFKIFLERTPRLQKNIIAEIKPRGYCGKHIWAEPPDKLQKIIRTCNTMVEQTLKIFSYNIKNKEPLLETILD